MKLFKSTNIRLRDSDIELVQKYENKGVMISFNKPIWRVALNKSDIIAIAKAIGIKPEDLS